MDKETLSNYGWIVICVLVLAVMIALATPFGSFISGAVQSTAQGLFDVNYKALNSTGLITVDDQEFDVPDMNHGAGETDDFSNVSPILAENDWATIQRVIKAGKVTEVGWAIGDLSPKFSINDKDNMQAILVDINETDATFMLADTIGLYEMNAYSEEYPDGKNIGGYAATEIKTLLDNIYQNKLDANLKAVISTTDITCAGGYDNPRGTSVVNCHLFLPSVQEMNQHELLFMWGYYPYEAEIRAEGEPFDYFIQGGSIEHDEGIWLRTPGTVSGECYFYNSLFGGNDIGASYENLAVYPAFVIG